MRHGLSSNAISMVYKLPACQLVGNLLIFSDSKLNRLVIGDKLKDPEDDTFSSDMFVKQMMRK